MVNIGELGVGLKLENWSIEKLTRDIQAKIRENEWDIEQGISKPLSKWLNKKKEVDELSSDIKKKISNAGKEAWGNLWSFLSKGIKIFAGLQLANWIKNLASKIISLWGALEQADIAFTTMLGGADAAKKMLQDLSDFAAKTPFELTGVRQTAKQLLAYGIEANKMIPTLKALGDVSAGLSVPIEQVAYAYGQVKSAGRLLGQDLRQFMNAGVPIIAELAKNLWVAESQIKKMVSEGKIWFADVEKAFQTMSSEGGKFANLMEKQSSTLGWLWSNLQDSLDGIWEKIGLSLIPLLSDMTRTTADSIEEFDAMGTSWRSATKMIAYGLAGIINWVRFVIKVIYSLWSIIGTVFWGVYTIVTSFFSDLRQWISKVAGSFGKAFKVAWNNIKVGIWEGINAAIKQVNGFLSRIKNSLKIDLWQIDPVNVGKYETFFDENPFKNTKNALEWTKQAFWSTFEELGDDWSNFLKGISDWYKNIDQVFSKTEGNLIGGSKNIGKHMNEEIWETSSWTSKKIDKLKETMDWLKKSLKDAEDADKKYRDSAEKTAEATRKYYEKLGDEIRQLKNKYNELTKEFEKTQKTDKESFLRTQVEKAKSLEQALLKSKSALQDIKADANKKDSKLDSTDMEILNGTDLEEAEKKLKSIQEELTKSTTEYDRERLKQKESLIEKLKEQLEIENNLKAVNESIEGLGLDQAILEREKKRAQMGEEAKAIYDWQAGQKKKQEEFEKKKKEMEDQLKIYKRFEEQKFLSSAEVAKSLTEENLAQFSVQERELILKLGRERIELEKQKEEKVAMEESLHARINQLSDTTTNLQLKNLGKLKAEYRTLISQIETAIRKRNELWAGKIHTRGFSIGGFTGIGANSDIAGVVHKNERVAPAWMTNKFADTFNQLERIRSRGFAQGGFTSDNSRHIEQNNTITVKNVFDMEEFLDRQRWKLR